MPLNCASGSRPPILSSVQVWASSEAAHSFHEWRVLSGVFLAAFDWQIIALGATVVSADVQTANDRCLRADDLVLTATDHNNLTDGLTSWPKAAISVASL